MSIDIQNVFTVRLSSKFATIFLNIPPHIKYVATLPCEIKMSENDTIEDVIFTCARKPTWVSLIYRTEPTTKKCETEKLKSKKRICSEVTVNRLENPWSQLQAKKCIVINDKPEGSITKLLRCDVLLYYKFIV